jgi:hypothetical protein
MWEGSHQLLREQRGILSSQREVGSARNAKIIISREEKSVIDAKSQELQKILLESHNISLKLIMNNLL